MDTNVEVERVNRIGVRRAANFGLGRGIGNCCITNVEHNGRGRISYLSVF